MTATNERPSQASGGPSGFAANGLGIVAAIAVLLAALAGRAATASNLSWYASLAKPPFNPPDWVFGPAWSLLYLLMAFAAWRIGRLPASPARRVALTLFFVQLALNAAWSWMFFAAHSPALGLVNIVPQLAAVIATGIAFYRLDRIAGLALAPLAAWVSFATLLNAAVWALNG
ncbi:MAG: TspO/MBR family protein [Pseudolabrys sp.]